MKLGEIIEILMAQVLNYSEKNFITMQGTAIVELNQFKITSADGLDISEIPLEQRLNQISEKLIRFWGASVSNIIKTPEGYQTVVSFEKLSIEGADPSAVECLEQAFNKKILIEILKSKMRELGLDNDSLRMLYNRYTKKGILTENDNAKLCSLYNHFEMVSLLQQFTENYGEENLTTQTYLFDQAQANLPKLKRIAEFTTKCILFSLIHR